MNKLTLRRLGPLFLGVSIAFADSYITKIKSADGELKSSYFTPHANSHHIPKIIHQTYKFNDLPHHFRVWREECMKLNPDWQFKLWTDEDNLRLVEEHYPHMLELYNGYDKFIKRVDMARYLFLHKFGGVYMDFDMTCLKPFNDTFDFYSGQFVIANQLPNERKPQYANAFMATPPGTKLLEYVQEWLPKYKDYGPIDATGPKFITKFLHSNARMPPLNGSWAVLPFELIYAQMSNKKKKCNSFRSCRESYPNAITVSLWTATWLGHNVNSTEWKEE